MATFHHEINRNNDRTLTITATHPDTGADYSLTGKTVWFTGKKMLTESDESAIIAKKTNDGITIKSPPDDNQAVVEISREDTVGITRKTKLQCDVQVKDSDNIWTVARGTIEVLETVTLASE